MIHYRSTDRVVVMDLVDLEHCGFSHDDFVDELFTSGLDDASQIEAQWPVALIVNFAGGHVLDASKPLADEQSESYKQDKAKFRLLLARLGWTL